MKWGMQNLLELGSLERKIEVCGELGLDFIELNMNLPECQPNRMDAEVLSELMEKHHVTYTFHVTETLDIATFDDDVREAYYMGLSKTIDLAKRLNVPIINMHMSLGIHFTLPDEKVYLYRVYQEEYLDKIRVFAEYVQQQLGHTGIRLAIENTGIYDVDYIRKAVDILLRKDNIVLTWDIGHDYSSNNKDKDFILNRAENLVHMHIHDAIGKDNHLLLYSGDIDIDASLDIGRDRRCTCVIEVKTLMKVIIITV